MCGRYLVEISIEPNCASTENQVFFEHTDGDREVSLIGMKGWLQSVLMKDMVTFNEAAAMLDEVADELPKAFFRDLNGGVYLLPETKLDSKSRRRQPLYILGEYIDRHDIGKFINLYYGSFMKVYPHLTPKLLKQALKRVLIHEFTHHLESLAGERELEIKDEIEMERYRRS